MWKTGDGNPVFFVSERAGELRAGMAGIVFKGRMGKLYESMADGTYGGPYYSAEFSDLEKSAFMGEFKHYLKSQKIIRADINNPTREIDSPGFEKGSFFTHVIDLSGGEYTAPRRQVDEHIRTAHRRGAKVTAFNDPDDIDDFYRLNAIIKTKHGQKPAFPRDFFSALFELSKKDDRILWLKVTYEDKMIASRISFVERGQLVNWQFYYDPDYNHLKPGYLLFNETINYVREKGLSGLNLGSSPKNAASLIRYKESLGGRRTYLRYYTYMNVLGRVVRWWRGK